MSQGRRPIFVSQLAHDDSRRQASYATRLGGANAHWQWSHGINFSGQREPSTRARSLAFYAFAVLAASRIAGERVQVFVPENGFICINPPLVPGRVSSLSTKTTHPQFIAMMQELLNGIGVGVVFELPYRFKTKGQMLQECLNRKGTANTRNPDVAPIVRRGYAAAGGCQMCGSNWSMSRSLWVGNRVSTSLR